MILEATKITKNLIKRKSITPHNEGAIELVASYLRKLGFSCKILSFEEKGSAKVTNLYAQLGKGKNFCFAGHTDVVPPGNIKNWKYDPFSGTKSNGYLYGRGVADMKGAIACFICATKRFLSKHSNNFDGSISLLITGDEEGAAINGTKKVLQWMKKNKKTIDFCLVGEPSNPNTLGEMIKIGRRGSLNVDLKVFGTQGHVAYPKVANNPITHLLKMLTSIKSNNWDNGSKHFDPSNLEVTSIDVSNTAFNVIPSEANAKFNIRFNDKHSKKSIEKKIRAICNSVYKKYSLTFELTGEPFLTKKEDFIKIISNSITKVTGKKPDLSTTGGTSDARFIHKYCPVVEFGFVNRTIHAENECVKIKDLNSLTKIYQNILDSYFKTKL